MKIASTISRLLLGLVFLVFGLNGFLQFIHLPPPPAMGGQFFGLLFASKYYVVIFALQIIAGVLLLVNRFVPLALTLITPVIVNIILFHLCLAPSGIPLATVVLLLELFLAWSYRGAFRSVLAFNAKPG